MPDKYNFDHYESFSPTVRCVEIGCRAGGALWEWQEEKRKEHFLSHNKDRIEELNNNNISFSNINILRKRNVICRICGSEFEQERKRGRPRVFCFACKPGE
jgi:hypothetical protein